MIFLCQRKSEPKKVEKRDVITLIIYKINQFSFVFWMLIETYKIYIDISCYFQFQRAKFYRRIYFRVHSKEIKAKVENMLNRKMIWRRFCVLLEDICNMKRIKHEQINNTVNHYLKRRQFSVSIPEFPLIYINTSTCIISYSGYKF